MMKRYLAVILCFLMPTYASAQMKPSTRQVCLKRCVKIDFAENPRTVQFKEKIRKIEEIKNSEKDSNKLSELQKEEEFETEKYSDFVDKLCTNICRNNPEE